MQEAAARPQPIAQPAQPGPALEAQGVTPYLGFLFLMLSTATLFDGFDSAMIGFAAPDVQATLGITTSQWGGVATLTRLGVMASFVFVFFADRIGRRRVVMGTIVGFTLANFATAFVTSTAEFVACQLVARLFLTAELSIAIIMVGEEFPARLRGRAIAILTSLATAGVMFMSKLQPYVLLSAGAESNAVHDLGHAMVTGVQSALGLPSDGAGWRSLYALGVLPLAAILLLRLGMRETRRFQAAKASAAARPKATWGELWHDVTLPWHAQYRRRTAIVALLWNCVYLVTGVSTVFYVIYARGTLHLTPFDVGAIVFWGYAGGVAGSFLGGWLIDRIGRKHTCAGAYVVGAVSIYALYHVTSVPAQYVSMIVTVMSFAGGLSATHVYASELFPTEIRATGYGWTTNLAGRVTEVGGPAVIGLLMARFDLSVPDAIAVLSIGPVIGALLVLRYAPETRGMTLEQIQQRLAS
ncbi:MAG TPA: MFS transporter [Myxococcota bacterium]|nr:MFS transporter [Myxococcota bacterium]